MHTHKFKLALLAVCGFIIFPSMSQANTAAIQLSDNSALFTIDFSFEDNTFASELPILTRAGATYADRIDEVGYTIQKRIAADNNPITSATGIVLAPGLTIVDGKYLVPAGTKQTFTLLILATFSEALSSDYQAKITKLPYWFDGRRTTVHQNQLDEIAPAVLEVE